VKAMDGGEKISVILMGHGSRVPDASRSMEMVAQALAACGRYWMVEVCHMSRMGPFFPEALKKLVEAGARRIILIPYFLHMGLHMRLDIPEMMREEVAKYPDVKLSFGPSLGFDQALVDLVARRIEDAGQLPDVRELELAPRESYPLPEGEMEFVAMPPEEAQKYHKDHGDGHGHDH